MPEAQPQQVLAALTEQVMQYRKLAKLADLQHDFVKNNQTDLLLDTLKKRQEVLDKLAVLEESIAPSKRTWGDYLATLPEGDRAVAESLLAESRLLLQEITTADRNDALVLQQRKLNLGQQIQRAGVARQLNRNYAASAYGGMQKSKMDVQR